MFRIRQRHERTDAPPRSGTPHRSALGRVSAAAAVAALAVGGLTALAAAPAYAEDGAPAAAPVSNPPAPGPSADTTPPADETSPTTAPADETPAGAAPGDETSPTTGPGTPVTTLAPLTTQRSASEPSPTGAGTSQEQSTTQKPPVVNIETLEACQWYEAEGFVEVGVLHAKQIAHGFLLLDGKPVKEDRRLHFDRDVPSGQHTVTLVWWDRSWNRHTTSTTFTIGPCPVLGVTAQPTCSLGETGTATITVTGVLERTHYEWWVSGPGYRDSGSYSEPFDVSGLAPGDYTVRIKAWHHDRDGYDRVWTKTTFAVAPCTPTIGIQVAQCSVPGGTASAVIRLGDLMAGVGYEVRVTDAGSPDGTPYGGVHTVTGDTNGAAQLTVSDLPAGRSLTAWVDGTWPSQQPEAQRLADPVDLAAHADVSTQPCPAAPSTPVAPAGLVSTGGTLAATGSDAAPLVGLGFVGIGLGGVVLAVSAIRRRRLLGR